MPKRPELKKGGKTASCPLGAIPATGEAQGSDVIAAAIILHGLISTHKSYANDLTNDEHAFLIKQSAQAAKLIRRKFETKGIEAHAYQLFEPHKTVSLKDAANAFELAEWRGLTSKDSVGKLFDELQIKLKEICDSLPLLTATEWEKAGESKFKAKEYAHQRERMKARLDQIKAKKTFRAYDLLHEAACHGIESAKLRRTVPIACVKSLEAKNPYGLLASAETGITPEAYAFKFQREIEILTAENQALRSELEKLKGMPAKA